MKQKKAFYFRKSLAIIFSIWVISFVLELFSVKPITLSFPNNIIALIVLCVICISSKLFIRHTTFFQWFSSIQNSIAVIIAFTGLSLLMAIIPQQENTDKNFLTLLGFNRITQTFYFQITYLYLLLTLGLVVVRRYNSGFTYRNVVFLLNHGGLWIILASGGLGSYDFEKVDMLVKLNNTVWYGYTSENDYVELPFAIELKKFDVSYFSPKLRYIKIDSNKGNVNIIKEWDMDTLKSIKYKDKIIRVIKYIPYTWWFNDTMYTIKNPGYVGSALVSVLTDKQEIRGWISFSSIMQKGKYLKINNQDYLFLAEPIPKDFTSWVKVYTSKGNVFDTVVKVNKPLNIMGWNVYQKDYHKELRDFSDYSIFEINRDPWLWLIYTGIFMLMLGSILLIFVKH